MLARRSPLIQLVAAVKPADPDGQFVPPPCATEAVPDGFCKKRLPLGFPRIDRATANVNASA